MPFIDAKDDGGFVIVFYIEASSKVFFVNYNKNGI